MTMTLRELLLLQVRVVGALVLRETRATFGTSQFGYLWAIVMPGAGILILVMVFSFVGRQAPFGSSFALFFATGVLTLEFFNKLSGTLMNTFDANKALLTYPPIKETDALFARLILISATYMVIMVLFFGGLILAGQAEFPTDAGKMMEAFAATALLGFGFGTLNAVLKSLWDSWNYVESILTRPLFFISAVFYIPSHMPPAAISILKWNPVLHLVEWMRVGYYPNYDSTVLSPSYPLGVGLLLTLVGLGGERLFRRLRN